MNNDLIIMGNGGHALVILEAIKLQGSHSILGFTTGAGSTSCEYWEGLAWLGDDNSILNYNPTSVQLVSGVGTNGTSNIVRIGLFSEWKKHGFRFATIIHPSAILSPNATIAEGVQILAGAVIQTNARVGANSILNTRSIIEHHCLIGDHCHVAPGAVLCGGVELGEGVHIGAGAVVKQGVRIGSHSVIGAGAVVIHDVPEYKTIAGVPAKEVRK